MSDDQSANKYVVSRTIHQVFGLLQRVPLGEQERAEIEDLKKVLAGQTDRYCSDEVKKLSL